MAFYAETLGLSDSAFTLLRDLIHERTGLFYENGKSELLTDKLSPLVIERGFSSFLDYYYLLKYDAGADQEWKRVINALSVQETFFWREVDQVRATVDVLVPQYFASHRARPLRIWSAACATGEEPLTIAMALDEAGWFDRAAIEIYASDASAAAIERARRGLYRERSFRSLPARLREKYFSEDQGGWRVAPELHARINWATANLMEESDVATFATAAIIFCRNVFIYFSENTIRKTVQLFARHMPAPGYLFVAASESLLRLTTGFQFQEIGGAFVYVKE
ncbi:MAG TPA: protein-glutamate O-methyltransferase CheR [Blastocatellia bacterium]|nr:protein-glutamate O-methyltransferase CheR [Blastocatellia bacterium]